MCSLKLNLTGSLKIKQVQKLAWRIRFSDLLKLKEGEVAAVIREIEQDSIFKKLIHPEDRDKRVIKFSRFPRAGLAENYFEINEKVISGIDGIDIESILDSNRIVLRLIKKIGYERFRDDFLYNERQMSFQELSGKCGISVDSVKKINNFINEVSIRGEFFHPSALNSGPGVRYTKIASIELDERDNKFEINMFSVPLARGRYVIDYERLSKIRGKNIFTKDELKRIESLVSKIELINARGSTIYRVIKNAVEKQSAYLKSDDIKDMVPFTRKELAEVMEVGESVVSRAVYGRSVVLPCGRECPISHLLPNMKRIRKNLIKEIISLKDGPVSDSEIKEELKNIYGIDISRRSISDYRRELKIPSVYKR